MVELNTARQACGESTGISQLLNEIHEPNIEQEWPYRIWSRERQLKRLVKHKGISPEPISSNLKSNITTFSQNSLQMFCSELLL